MLLVYGALPRPARLQPALTQCELAYAIDLTMVEVQKEQAKQRMDFGLKHVGGPCEI